MTAGLFWHGEPWLRDEDLRQQREALATEMLIQQEEYVEIARRRVAGVVAQREMEIA